MPTNIPGGALGPATYGPGTPGYGISVPQQGTSVGAGGTNPGYSGAGGGPFVGAQGPDFTYEQPADPRLQAGLFSYLGSQVGQGVTPFNLATQLPFGGTTQRGQLTA